MILSLGMTYSLNNIADKQTLAYPPKSQSKATSDFFSFFEDLAWSNFQRNESLVLPIDVL